MDLQVTLTEINSCGKTYSTKELKNNINYILKKIKLLNCDSFLTWYKNLDN